MSLDRRIVRYTGQVQGVGFRATTRDLAAGFAVTGYVQNLEDGSVRMVAEGPTEQLDCFQRAIRGKFGARIAAEHCDSQSPSGGFDSFDIRY